VGVGSIASRASSSATIRSCSANTSSSVPSSLLAPSAVPLVASWNWGVIRIRPPSTWYAPDTTQRAPTVRPIATACSAVGGSRRAAGSSGTTRTPVTRCRSTATVSAMPVPSQSWSAAPDTFTNSSTATAWAGEAAGRAPPVAPPPASASANASSVGNRAAGSASRARAMASSSSAGTGNPAAASDGAPPVSRWASIACAVGPRKGSAPVSSS
jgi:hypothetical protein